MTTPKLPPRRIVYFVRTDTLQKEARVARLFGKLMNEGCEVEVFAIVKRADGFAFPHREYVCRSDNLRRKTLKLIAKLFEIQVAAFRAYRAMYRNHDMLIVANHEFLLFGLLLRLFNRTPVIVDLHEHYFRRLFAIKKFSQFFFLKAFSGVIFANSMRARDFLSDRDRDENVVILRNFPQLPAGAVSAPKYSPSRRYRVAIVGGDVPGRFGIESARALDHPDFHGRLELVTFGGPLRVNTTHVPLSEHGRYRHWEIFDLLKGVDCSLVFYDPSKSPNNLLCEPNRFFEAYNSGLTIFCFDHPSLAEFYDECCIVIDKDNFEHDLIRSIEEAMVKKAASHPALLGQDPIDRKLLVYEDGIVNLEFLLRAEEY